VLPAAVVKGIGAVVDETPPVTAVYHLRLTPIAESATAFAAPWQYVTVVVTIGAEGVEFTVTVIEALFPSHPLTV